MMKKINKITIAEQFGIVDKNGLPFEIPVDGSVSLLALGYRGLMAWRAQRIEEANINQARNASK